MPPSALFVAALAIPAACAGTPLPPPPPDVDFAAALTAAEFPGAAAMVAGIAAPAAPGDSAWRIGDELLLGVRLDDHGEVTRWLVRLRVRAPDLTKPDGSNTVHYLFFGKNQTVIELSTCLAGIDIALADADGNPLDASTAEVPRDMLANGFVAACAQQATATSPADIDPGEQTKAFYSLTSMLRIVRQDPTLRTILFRVVDKPSLLSILWHFGARVGVRTRFDDCVQLDATPPQLPAGEPAWLVPVDLVINDSPALYCNLLVGNPAPPFHLCGGILGADATRPSDPQLRFRFAVLGARRGDG